jgi:uncharacterized sulfatase
VLSGRPIWNIGQAGLLYGTLDADLPLFTHLLAESGYHVGYTGKGWAPGDWRAGGLTDHPNGKEYNERKVDSPPPGIDPRDYAANFEDFLTDRSEDQPFFFWLGSFEPHRVYDKGAGRRAGKSADAVRVPAYWPDVEEVRNDILDYYTEIDWFDRQLGRAIEMLEDRGELDNTIIVVTSDNGMPFPRAKVNLYDAGVRMPLAIRWGDRVTGGRTIDDFVSHADFAPTFLEAAGITVPESMQGSSLMPLLESAASGQIDPARDHIVTALERHTYCRPEGATYPIRALRTADFLYIRNFEPDRWPTGGPDFVSSNKTPHGDVDGCPTKDFFLRQDTQQRFPQQYELCFGKRPPEEFYRIEDDPDQVRNLIHDDSVREEIERHRQRLEAILRETGDPRIDGRDPWQAYPYRQTIGYGATYNTALTQEQRDRAAGRGAHKPE